jgi:PST family polysaccharide transporter
MLADQFKKVLSNQFIRNIGWLGVAELANRVFRLGTTITIARVFSPEDYGLMAIIYTVNDFATLIPQRGGIGLKIVQADEENIEQLCNTGYWLNWILAVAFLIIQCLSVLVYALISGENRLVLPLCVASLSYLIFPLSCINISLLERANQLKTSAVCSALQSLVSNVLIAILALLGFGIWAIVLSMLVAAPIWWILGWRNHPWRPPKHFTVKNWQEIFHFSKNITLMELLNRLRMNIDYIIVGFFLGNAALGTYYFAFNAGSGITINIVNSVLAAVFTHLCAARGDKRVLQKNYLSSLKTIMMTVVPVVLLQSSLAPIYVPIVFGEKWDAAIPIVMMICTSVIPFAFSLIALLLLNAIDKTDVTLRLDAIFTLVFAICIAIAVNGGIIWVAATVAIANWLVLPIISIWATRFVFKSR